MNAAKFIADKGWEYTKTHLEKMDTENWHNDWFKDLKRYVDAWELVQIHGFEQSKEIVKNAPSDEHFYSWSLGNSGVKDKTVNIGELRKAIALVKEVESLKEVS